MSKYLMPNPIIKDKQSANNNSKISILEPKNTIKMSHSRHNYMHMNSTIFWTQTVLREKKGGLYY